MSEKQRIKRQTKSKTMAIKSVQVKVKQVKQSLKDQLSNAYIQGQLRILGKVRAWLQLAKPNTGKKLADEFEAYLQTQK